jgi:hypothetical protein
MYEYCFICDCETGRAGAGDDSIYDSSGNGPYCEDCYAKAAQRKISANQRKATERTKKRIAGLVQVEVWIKPEHKQKLKTFLNQLTGVTK